ncbi:Y-family DNA polymerase [Rubellimicrobium arenae]|uniref:Y-family DNA polymerase n=1 Tax=Rubellimicrobium arenae TaxID=2817372 RepID=UPI001FED5242|nr:DNA polymerase Y family protein [Rubellimicrobium arenae]
MPFALVLDGPHGPVVHATTPAAEEAGVRPGLRAVDARAVCPSLRVDEADPRGDEAALLDLALWARRWCPWTAVDGPGGIAMDVTGSTHLQGGEAAMLEEIGGRLAGLGLSCRLAIAPTRGAAWALARFGTGREICDAPDLAARTGPLPVRALRLGEDTALLLRRLGIRTVDDLSAVPRLSLARRFARAEAGDNPLVRLDQMMGRLPEPLHCPDEPPRFLARAVLSEPMLDPTPLLPALAGELCAMLAAKGFGARRVMLALFRSDGAVSSVEAATARATRDPLHLARLFEGKLERLDPGFGFDLVTLGATGAEELRSRQPGLDSRRDEGEELARFVDRVSARFGPQALLRPGFQESHIPERREAWTPALGPQPPLPPVPHAPRPLRLFDPPEEVQVVYAVPEGPPAQFVWRRMTHRVTRFAGPERIAPEWWRDRPGTRLRDYYRVEDHTGRRFWLYREGVVGDGRGGTPRWFMHGAFA